MNEGSTFNKVSLMFLKKDIFKNFGGGGGEQKRASCGLYVRKDLSPTSKFCRICFLKKKLEIWADKIIP